MANYFDKKNCSRSCPLISIKLVSAWEDQTVHLIHQIPGAPAAKNGVRVGYSYLGQPRPVVFSHFPPELKECQRERDRGKETRAGK
jgi:hypothetical protein